MEKEIWKDIPEYERLYQVSNKGRIRSLTHYARNNKDGGMRLIEGMILSPFATPTGYMQVLLSKGKDIRKKHYVHRLVATAFLSNKSNLSDVNHIDGNKSNNVVDNLEWCTHKDNQRHMVQNRMTKKAKPVFCMELNRSFCSMTVAEKETGIDRHFIKRSCRTGESYKGYHWREIM